MVRNAIIKKLQLLLVFSFVFWIGCSSSDDSRPSDNWFPPTNPPSQENPASIGIVGNKSDIETNSKLGLVIMGGSTDVDQAIQWMIERSGGGDAVVIRASGSDAYNSYIYELGNLNSVETLLIDSRSLANNEKVAQTIRNAELLFIAGGDQSNYRDFWRGTKTEGAINYLLNEKKVPVGGTSAGAAILGNLYFSGENGTVTSEEALSNPFNNRVTLYVNDFLEAPYMEKLITDQHFSQRDRSGRLVTFLARLMTDYVIEVKAIGVDEKTAVCINENGIAKVFGSNSAYFLKTDFSKQPETVQHGQKLNWNQNEKAISAYRIGGNNQGNGQFNVHTFDESTANGGASYWWWVTNGSLNQKYK